MLKQRYNDFDSTKFTNDSMTQIVKQRIAVNPPGEISVCNSNSNVDII